MGHKTLGRRQDEQVSSRSQAEVFKISNFGMRISDLKDLKTKISPLRRRGRRGKDLLFVGRRRQIIDTPWKNAKTKLLDSHLLMNDKCKLLQLARSCSFYRNAVWQPGETLHRGSFHQRPGCRYLRAGF